MRNSYYCQFILCFVTTCCFCLCVCVCVRVRERVGDRVSYGYKQNRRDYIAPAQNPAEPMSGSKAEH